MSAVSKLSLVEGTFEELAAELAAYINDLGGQCEVQSLDKEAALKKLVTASAVLTSAAPEKELQAAYNLLIHLVSQAEDPDIYLPPICKYLSSPITSSPQNGTGIALGILGTLFNTIPPNDDTRQHVLLAIVELIKTSNNYETLQPQLIKNLDSWVNQWELDPEEARSLYLSIAEAASAANKVEDSYAYLLKALRTLQSAPSSQEARDLSIRALKTALDNDKHFDFEDLTTLDSIQALSKTDQTLSEILELFSAENYDDLQDFKEANPTFCSENGLNEEVLDRKMRLLTIASLSAQASHSRTLAYSTIAKALAIPTEDVEVWIIDCIRSGLVEGKLSQRASEFLIHRSTYRVFGENQWREVASRLETWKTSLRGVLEVIRAQKEDFAREKDAEQTGRPIAGHDRRQRYGGLASVA